MTRSPHSDRDTQKIQSVIDRLLVVDDEPVVCELIREVFHDHDVTCAASVAEARALILSSERFEVALIDKNLPDGSGVELARSLRQEHPELEMLLITAFPSFDSALEVIDLGAVDYLVKPFPSINDLRLRVGNALRRVRGRRSERALTDALRDSEQRYRELFEASPDAILIIDPETRRVCDANRAAERLYQYGRDELLAKTIRELVAESSSPELHDGVVVRTDRRADGSTVPVEVTTGFLHRGGCGLSIEVVRDVSERERQQRIQNELSTRLERTQKLEAIGRLGTGVAHDLNNLLLVIQNCSAFAAEFVSSIPSDAAREALVDLESVAKASLSAADLTRRLLAFAGRGQVRRRVLDLNAAIESTAKMLRRTIEAHVYIELALAADPLQVVFDPGQLEQVITNRAVTARDAMPEGGRLTIETRLGPGDPTAGAAPSGAVVVVRDTGVGVPAEMLTSIFEPFFTTQGDRGTGLGLATVKQIVTSAGGHVHVTSSAGVGTSFEIWLPITTHQVDAITRPISIGVGRGERVLVVDDDPLVREVTRRVLAAAGYAVHAARTGEEGVRIAKRVRPELAVIDLLLPGISGVECASQLREQFATLAVIHTSGAGTAAVALPTRGHDRFLPKPYSADDLLAEVRKSLDHIPTAEVPIGVGGGRGS